MKFFQQVLLTIALLLTQITAHAELYLVGLTDPAALDLQFRDIANLPLSLKKGDRFKLYDLANNKTVVTIAIDDDIDSEIKQKQFVRQHAAAFKSIKTYLNQKQPNPPNGQQHFLFPQFLEEVSTHVVQESEKLHVLLAGDGLYHDQREPHFSMLEERFPSDGHLIAGITRSVFSTVAKEKLLKGANINYVYTNDWKTDIHKNRIHRFWYLFVKSQGGKLTTFSPDFQTGLSRLLLENPPIRINYELDQSDRKVNMIGLKRTAIRNAVAAPETAPEEPMPIVQSSNDTNDISWLEDNTPLYEGQPVEYVGTVKVGIRWNCKKCDYDLWTKSANAKKWLYFSNKTSPEGYFSKDYTNSPDKANALEYSVFEKDVDIRTLQIRVNLYAGNLLNDRKGEVRAYYKGQVYSLPFEVNSSTGDTTIDPKKLFNINDQQYASGSSN